MEMGQLWCCGLGEPYLPKENVSFNKEELEDTYSITLPTVKFYSKI